MNTLDSHTNDLLTVAMIFDIAVRNSPSASLPVTATIPARLVTAQMRRTLNRGTLLIGTRVVAWCAELSTGALAVVSVRRGDLDLDTDEAWQARIDAMS